jgi:6-pyruvoyltetrahydropterin/6-carboxytetrahydropterin synthase
MYTLAVQRDFVARHFLIGGDWGPENDLHAHHYRVEVRLEGAELDQHGYLVDIVEVECALDELVSRYRDGVLNQIGNSPALTPASSTSAASSARRFPLGSGRRRTVIARIWENQDRLGRIPAGKILTFSTQGARLI